MGRGRAKAPAVAARVDHRRAIARHRSADCEDLRLRHPWEIRRGTLTGLLRRARPGVRLSEHLDGDGETIFRHACALGAEGIVAKRRDRPYRSGRCADWIKVKNPDATATTRVIER